MSAQPEPATQPPEILARGPWAIEQVRARWREDQFEPSPDQTEAADAAIRGLEERGGPRAAGAGTGGLEDGGPRSHDGMAARLVDYRENQDGIAIELQPLRWALRLVV